MSALQKLQRDTEGATIVEFALIAPTMLLMMCGIFELGHTMYVQSIVNGAIQEAGRDSTVEKPQIGEIEANVRKTIRNVAPGAKIEFKRQNYSEYRTIDRLELFTDLNGDGVCNDGEAFEDLNDSGKHDKVTGRGGQGGADDIVVYQTIVTYDRLFPMPSLDGWAKQTEIVGTTLLRNQPYREKERRVKVLTCN